MTPADRQDEGTDTPSLADLVEEVTNRAQAGESVDVEALLREHPRHAGRLRQLLPAIGLLVHVAGESTTAVEAPTDDAEGGRLPGHSTLGDYRVVREVGRGGMGVVYEAVQVSLGRRVALKVLALAATSDPRQIQRFYTEARAAAQLQHANIVPVYGVGRERGLHYYAMQFIDGRTLAQVIAGLRRQAEQEGAASTSSPGFFSAAARLGVQAAEALDHAHQVGVVHRDVKPANLLLDGRGHLWVADFGLAQTQADSGLTQTGDLVGTLRYMSPEQALGRRGVVDHRSDVYALGATLYELLALRPALPGQDRQELLRRLACDDPVAPPPSRWNRAIPADLETVVLKAMARQPEERYATAQELADDLRRFLDGRPVRARRPTPWQRAGKWARRHPGAVAAALLGLLLLSAGSGLSAALVRRERDLLRQEQGRTAAALEGEARRGRLARRALDRMSSQVIDDWLARQPRLSPEQRAFLELSLADYEELAREQAGGADAEARAGLAVAHLRTADIRGLLGQEAQAEQAYRRGQGILRGLVAGGGAPPHLRKNLAASHHHIGNLLLRTGRTGDAAAEYREAVAVAEGLSRDFPEELDYAASLVGSQTALARALHELGEAALAEDLCRRALALARRWEPRGPAGPALRANLGFAWHRLGDLLRERQRTGEAERAYREALAVRRRLAEDVPVRPYRAQLAATSRALGLLLRQVRRWEEAAAALRAARAEQRRLVGELPGIPAHRASLAVTTGDLAALLGEMGHSREAEQARREQVALNRQLARDYPSDPAYQADLAKALDDLGLLLGSRRPAEAESALREAASLRAELTRRAPKVPAYRAALAGSYYNLGLALKAGGRLAEAESAYRGALAEQRRVARDEPGVPAHRAAVASTLNNLGNVQRDRGRLREAEGGLRAALAIREELARAAPAVVSHRADLADTLDNLALVLVHQGRQREALAAYRRSVPLRERLVGDLPGQPEPRSRLGTALHHLAWLGLVENRQVAEARPLMEQAVGHWRAAWELAPGHPGYRDRCQGGHHRLANLLADWGEHAEAAATAEAMAGLAPGEMETSYLAYAVLVRCARLAARDPRLADPCRPAAARSYAARARGLLRAGLARGGDPAEGRNRLARRLATDGDLTLRDAVLAEELTRELIRRAPENAAYWNTRALALYRTGDWPGAEAALERAVRLGGGNGGDWFLLAMARWRQRDAEQARAWYDRAVRWTEAHAPGSQELRRLRAEAEALLAGDAH